MPPNPAFAALLARQNGLVTYAQATRHLSASTVQRNARTGRWKRVHSRVFLVSGHPHTDAVAVRAASLWAGDDTAVSGPAAAWWHEMLPKAPAEIEMTVPRQRGIRSCQGIRIRRRDLHAADQVGAGGIWLTGKPLTALETAITVPDGSVFLDRALQKHLTFEDVYRCYSRNMGAKGAARIAELLIASADRADSVAERLMLSILRESGLTGWEHGRPFGRWTIDFAFPAAGLAIEVDGWAWHMDVDRFRADRHKGNALVRGRWDLLRFTWHDLTNRPDYVIGEIRAALAAAVRSA